MIVSIPLASIARGAPDADLLRRLALSDRKLLESFINAAIDALDTVDGDPDLEEDDPSGQADEDGINTATPAQTGLYFRGYGPGCELSDPGGHQEGSTPVFIPICTPILAERARA